MTCTVTATDTTTGGAANGAAGTSSGTTLTLSGPQATNAQTIIAATKALGMGQNAAALAIMVARQESSLANLANPTVPASLDLPHDGSGHNADSVGLFQQRPSMGWGSVEELMTPSYAATAFLRALAGVPSWQAMAPAAAAQAVQRSADGSLYAQWAGLGTAVTAALWDSTSGSLTCTDTLAGGAVNGDLPAPNTAVAAAVIAYARNQLGKPYIYGGTGPTGYDCSGLVFEAFASAGISLPRTAEYQVGVGAAVPADQLQPGDLVFFNPGEQIAGRPGHVGIYLGNGLMLDAPHTGTVIRIEPVASFGTYVGARRIVG